MSRDDKTDPIWTDEPKLSSTAFVTRNTVAPQRVGSILSIFGGLFKATDRTPQDQPGRSGFVN
jgi:hypothetical protein